MSSNQERWESHERRKRPRVPLHWTLYLTWGPNSQLLETVTANLSSEGFFCQVPMPIHPGAYLECILVIPSQGRDPFVCLQGKVQVVRSETKGACYFIGCQIHEYRVTSQSSVQALHAQLPQQASLV